MSGEMIITSRDAFGQFRVKELTERDFSLQSATPTALLSPKCHIVLFYESSSTSIDLITLWNNIAQTIAGPIVCAVNTSSRTEIMSAFMDVGADLDNPLNPFTGFSPPVIIVYRSRWPQAFYNGQLSYDAIKKWIMVLACKPGYREPYSLYHGVGSVQVEEYVRDPRIQDFPYPTSSRDFTALLGENPRDDTVYVDQVVEEPSQTEVVATEEVATVSEEIQVDQATTVEESPVEVVVQPTVPVVPVARRGCRDVGFNV